MHFSSCLSLRRVLAALILVIANGICSQVSFAQTVEPGAEYVGSPVSRLYGYVFIDMHPLVPREFTRQVKDLMSQELSKGGVAYEQVWFSDTKIGREHIANPKAHTAANLVDIPLGGTVRENFAKDLAFKPSHRLFVYPTQENRDGTYTVRWEFRNTQTGYIDWALYTNTPPLWSDMESDRAQAAATAFVNVVMAELRRCKVMPDIAS